MMDAHLMPTVVTVARQLATWRTDSHDALADAYSGLFAMDDSDSPEPLVTLVYDVAAETPCPAALQPPTLTPEFWTVLRGQAAARGETLPTGCVTLLFGTDGEVVERDDDDTWAQTESDAPAAAALLYTVSVALKDEYERETPILDDDTAVTRVTWWLASARAHVQQLRSTRIFTESGARVVYA